MISLLLAIIYLSFVSLGLPDQLLGSAWPLMSVDLGASLSMAGGIYMIIALGTVASSLMSDRLTHRFGAAKITAVSALLISIALFGFSVADSYWLLCLIAVPYGLGAGAVDAALNNYVAIHYASKHMIWLHCCWGVGAALGPYILSLAMGLRGQWRDGYGAVAIVQLAMTAALFASVPLWKGKGDSGGSDGNAAKPLGIKRALGIKNVKPILVAFLCYCAFETTAGLWASSYLVEHHGVDAETAAAFGAMFCLGITIGRFACGFIADRVCDKNMIRMGVAVSAAGLLLIALPCTTLSTAGLVISGIGAAPVYPAIIHSTPEHFGKENSGAIVGIQMASAYMGSALVPPLFGVVAQHIGIGLFPYFLSFFVVLLFVLTERVNRSKKRKA